MGKIEKPEVIEEAAGTPLEQLLRYVDKQLEAAAYDKAQYLKGLHRAQARIDGLTAAREALARTVAEQAAGRAAVASLQASMPGVK